MKRNFDLIRQLLKTLERRDDRCMPTSTDLLIAGFSKKDVDLHIELLKEARMVDAVIKYDGQEICLCANIRLLNAGHDVLDVVREELDWRKIKGFLGRTAETTVSASIMTAARIWKETLERDEKTLCVHPEKQALCQYNKLFDMVHG